MVANPVRSLLEDRKKSEGPRQSSNEYIKNKANMTRKERKQKKSRCQRDITCIIDNRRYYYR